MGQDKAGLLIEGKPLWQRQVATLEAAGPSEILISGRGKGLYAGSQHRIIEDNDPGLGPLGGVVSALEAAKHSMLVVLAIDLPRMNGEFLRTMLSRGPMVWSRGGRFEPLAAIYSKGCLDVLRGRLAQRQLSMQDAVRELAERGELTVAEVSPNDAPLFDNLNTPEDLAFFVEGSHTPSS